MGPFIRFVNQAMLSFFATCPRLRSGRWSSGRAGIAGAHRNFQRIEKFQGEAHEYRVETIRRIGQGGSVSGAQLDEAGDPFLPDQAVRDASIPSERSIP